MCNFYSILFIYFFFYNILNLNNPVFKLLLFDANTHLSAGHGERYLEIGTRLVDGLNKTPDFLIIPLLINLFFLYVKIS